MIEYRYMYEDYPIKIVKRLDNKEYNIEEELYVNKVKECQDLYKQLEEINIDDLLMNVESKASNASNNNN